METAWISVWILKSFTTQLLISQVMLPLTLGVLVLYGLWHIYCRLNSQLSSELFVCSANLAETEAGALQTSRFRTYLLFFFE